MLRNSQIAVNLELVEPDYVLQEGDVLTHCNHRHENPVLDRVVDTVYEDEEMLAVSMSQLGDHEDEEDGMKLAIAMSMSMADKENKEEEEMKRVMAMSLEN